MIKFAMMKNLKDIRFITVSTVSLKNSPMQTTIQTVPEKVRVGISRDKKEEDVKTEAEETTLPFEKWNLPPQPEDYIQFLPYDLL
jgi:ribosomal protein L31E